MGDLSITRIDEHRYWLTGSYYLQDFHMRWFREQPVMAGVLIRNVTDEWMGFSVSGPASRAILEVLTPADVANDAFPFMAVAEIDVGSSRAVVGRISLTGELGYEVVVPTNRHRRLLDELLEAGAPHGMRLVGDRAVDSLRLEKGYGIWSAEYRQDCTPAMCGLDRYVAFDKGDFVGRDAALAERERDAGWRLVLLDVDAADADASTDEGIWIGDRRVGMVTSGAYGHHVKRSLALAYLESDVADAAPDLTVYVVGDERIARILPEPPYDPRGERLREASPVASA